MPSLSPEERFLQQGAKGSRFWRQQRVLALGLAFVFTVSAMYQLWKAWARPSGSPMTDVLGILPFLGLAAAAAVWHIHAEIMHGAAVFLERQSKAP